jgi:LmbE family N-acetylglucosaminyl deacetylase
MREVVRIIRRLQPFAVVSHDPNQIVRNAFINHPDHRAVGEVVLDAVYPIARNRPSFPELLEDGLEPFSVREVYLWSASDTNYETDITDVLEIKFEALSRHETQIGDMEELRGRLMQFWRDPDGRYVERFRRIALPF